MSGEKQEEFKSSGAGDGSGWGYGSGDGSGWGYGSGEGNCTGEG